MIGTLFDLVNLRRTWRLRQESTALSNWAHAELLPSFYRMKNQLHLGDRMKAFVVKGLMRTGTL